MQATEVLAGNSSFAGEEWSDTTSFRIDFGKSRPHSFIEHWSDRIESIATTVSEKTDQLTREESDNFGQLLEENDQRRKHFRDTIDKGILKLWQRRKSGLTYELHCRMVCNMGLKLSTTAAKRLLQAHARDSGDLSAPAVQVTTTLLTDEPEQTNKLSSVDLPTPRVVTRKRQHSTNSPGPSESLDSGSDMQILTEAMNNFVLPSLCKARSASSQSSGSQLPQPNNPEDSKLRLNESTFFDHARNVDISDSHFVSASGDYNDNHFTALITVNLTSPVQTSDIETREPDEIHSETSREEPQHIDDDRTRTSLANQGGTLDQKFQNSPTSDSSDTEGAGSVTNAASEVHMSFEEALRRIPALLYLMLS